MSDHVRPKPTKLQGHQLETLQRGLELARRADDLAGPCLQWSDMASGKRGRIATFSDAAIQFCVTIKGLFGLALRQAMGMIESQLKLAGLPLQVPDYSTVCRRQKKLKVRIPYRPAAQGLHLLVDSTGLKMMGEGEWKTKKHGAEYRRQWRELHLGVKQVVSPAAI
jgi:Transposase DDE domain